MERELSINSDIGLWREPRRHRSAEPISALFVDRDGVINEEINYLHRVEDLRLTRDCAAAIAAACCLGLTVVVVTNQAGIGRGLFQWSDFNAIQAEIDKAVREAGGNIAGVYACAYHEQGVGSFRVAQHEWRKPNAGMLLAAAVDLNINLNKSWIIGDRVTDISAGQAAGLRGGTIVSTGYGGRRAEIDAALAIKSQKFNVRTAKNLADAIKAFGTSLDWLQ